MALLIFILYVFHLLIVINIYIYCNEETVVTNSDIMKM